MGGDEISTNFNTLPGRAGSGGCGRWPYCTTLGWPGVGPGQFEPLVMVLYPPFFTGLLGAFNTRTISICRRPSISASQDWWPSSPCWWAVEPAWRWLFGRGASRSAANQPLTALTIGLFGSLLALAVHGLVDAPLVAPRGYALAFALLGMAAASNQLLMASFEQYVTETKG